MINLIFLLTFAFTHNDIPYQHNAKLWTDGDLTWEDFKTTSKYSYDSDTCLKTTLKFGFVRTNHDDTIIINRAALSLMRKSDNFILPKDTTSALLKYYQTIFDIQEHTRILLQNELFSTNRLPRPFVIQQTKNNQNNINKFKEMSAFGENQEYINHYSDSIRQIINNTIIVDTPSYKISDFAIGYFYGYNQTNYFNNKFPSTSTVDLGLCLKQSKTSFLGNLQFGNSKNFIDDFYEDTPAPEITPSQVTRLSFAVGYDAINTLKHALTPFAGFSYSKFKPIKNYTLNQYNLATFQMGVKYDFIFRKAVKIYVDEYVQRQLSIKVFSEGLTKGYGFSIGLSPYFRKAKVRRQYNPAN
jgi:hypothetical protein